MDLEQRVRELVASGMSEEDARSQAAMEYMQGLTAPLPGPMGDAGGSYLDWEEPLASGVYESYPGRQTATQTAITPTAQQAPPQQEQGGGGFLSNLWNIAKTVNPGLQGIEALPRFARPQYEEGEPRSRTPSSRYDMLWRTDPRFATEEEREDLSAAARAQEGAAGEAARAFTRPAYGGGLARTFTAADWAKYNALSPEDRQRFLTDPTFQSSFVGGLGPPTPGTVGPPIVPGVEDGEEEREDLSAAARAQEGAAGEAAREVTEPPAYGTDEYWRWVDKKGRDAQFSEVWENMLYRMPSYLNANPMWQNFQEERFDPLRQQHRLQTALRTGGIGDYEPDHLKGYLAGNPGVEGQNWWSDQFNSILGGLGAQPPMAGAGATESQERIDWEALRKGLGNFGWDWFGGALDAGSPVTRSMLGGVAGDRYKRWKAQNPTAKQADFWMRNLPALSGVLAR